MCGGCVWWEVRPYSVSSVSPLRAILQATHRRSPRAARTRRRVGVRLESGVSVALDLAVTYIGVPTPRLLSRRAHPYVADVDLFATTERALRIRAYEVPQAAPRSTARLRADRSLLAGRPPARHRVNIWTTPGRRRALLRSAGHAARKILIPEPGFDIVFRRPKRTAFYHRHPVLERQHRRRDRPPEGLAMTDRSHRRNSRAGRPRNVSRLGATADFLPALHRPAGPRLERFRANHQRAGHRDRRAAAADRR